MPKKSNQCSEGDHQEILGEHNATTAAEQVNASLGTKAMNVPARSSSVQPGINEPGLERGPQHTGPAGTAAKVMANGDRIPYPWARIGAGAKTLICIYIYMNFPGPSPPTSAPQAGPLSEHGLRRSP